MVKLVDTLVLEASAERCDGSSPSWGTNHGDEASMVMQWTVNPPANATTGSIPVISTKLGNVAESGLLQQS